MITVKQLLDSGVNVNQIDKDGVTLLHWAAINGRLDVAALLVTRGAKVDLVGGVLKSTPLHWAVRENHFRMLLFLLKNGARISARDSEGYEPIHLAAINGSMGIVAYLLAQGISPNVQNGKGMTPIMCACTRRSE